MLRILGTFFLCLSLRAEVITLTLKQAVDRALKQNPELMMARFDEQKALQGVRVAKDPFVPRVDLGSGIAYTNGFPQSIEGSAPSIIQARACAFIFNRQQSFLVAEARENARTAGFATASKREDIAYRTTSLYVDADRAARLAGMARKQTESLQKVAQTVRGRVQEGRELPIEVKRAALESLKGQQRAETLEADAEFAQRSLAVVLGYSADDHVQTASDEREAPAIPASEQDAVEVALASNKEIRRLQSALVAKGLEARADKAARMPHVDLVAQYALFSRYNHLDEYFRKFQRNNEEFGMSFQLPLMPGPGVNAQIMQAEADSAKLRAQLNALRNQIALDVHQSYTDIRKTEMARSVAQADLDLARESLSIVLAQMQEGRAPLRQVEEARLGENEKWIAFYDAQFNSEKARFAVLRQTGELVASLK